MSEQFIRFLRAEVIARWPIDPDRIPSLDGSSVQLAAFLRDHFDFSDRRACAEADEFLCEFDARLRQATQLSTPPAAELMARPSAA
jgi:hypothetical protein